MKIPENAPIRKIIKYVEANHPLVLSLAWIIMLDLLGLPAMTRSITSLLTGQIVIIISAWIILHILIKEEREEQNKPLVKDESAASPLITLLTVMFVMIISTFAIVILGAYFDSTLNAFNNIPIQLTWTKSLTWFPNLMGNWFYSIIIFFNIVVWVWAVKNLIKRHPYTRPQDEMGVYEDF